MDPGMPSRITYRPLTWRIKAMIKKCPNCGVYIANKDPRRPKIKTNSWHTKSGKKRVIRLYRAWKGMNSRCRGHSHDGRGNYRWAGLAISWPSFPEFRVWAIANGYSKHRCSLDRIDSSLGYSPENCRWLTKADNCRLAVSKKPVALPLYL